MFSFENTTLRQCLGQTLHSLGKIQCFHDFSSNEKNREKNRFAKYFEPVKNSENQYLPHIKKPLKLTVFQKMNIFNKQNIKL